MPKIVFHPDAVSEIDDAWTWYDQKSESTSAQFLIEVQPTLRAIQNHPQTGPLYSSETRRLLLHNFPYAIIYGYMKSVIHVMAISHTSRKPFYGLSRMD